MDRPLSAAWPAFVVFKECDSADAEPLEVGDDGSVYGRGDEEGVFSADAEELSMSIIMTLIPLFGSKSGRFRGGVSRGVDRWPSNRLFVLKPTQLRTP